MALVGLSKSFLLSPLEPYPLNNFSKGINFKIKLQIHVNNPIPIQNNHDIGSNPHYTHLIAFPKNVKNITYKIKIIQTIIRKYLLFKIPLKIFLLSSRILQLKKLKNYIITKILNI